MFYFLPCVLLFLCFSVLLALRLPRLGNREQILVLFVRLFDLCLFGFIGFLGEAGLVIVAFAVLFELCYLFFILYIICNQLSLSETQRYLHVWFEIIVVIDKRSRNAGNI